MHSALIALLIIILTSLSIFFLNRKAPLKTISSESFKLSALLSQTTSVPHKSWRSILPHPVTNQVSLALPESRKILSSFTPSLPQLKATLNTILSTRINGTSEVLLNIWSECAFLSTELLLSVMFMPDPAHERCAEDLVDMLDSSRNFLRLPFGQFLYRISWNDTITDLEKDLDRCLIRGLRGDFEKSLQGTDKALWRGVCLCVLSIGAMKLRSLLFLEWVDVRLYDYFGYWLDVY